MFINDLLGSVKNSVGQLRIKTIKIHIPIVSHYEDVYIGNLHIIFFKESFYGFGNTFFFKRIKNVNSNQFGIAKFLFFIRNNKEIRAFTKNSALGIGTK